jgi:predicted  nucleic acid-binding Zn-ribbon protein
MSERATLYRLQCLDSEADARQRRLKDVEAALGESETLRQARRAVEDAQAQAHRSALRQRDLELESEGLGDKISRSEQRLYSGALKNPKELDDLQKDIASLRRRRQQLEDEQLEVMIERENRERMQADAQKRLVEIQAHWSAQQADLLGEREALQGRLAEIEQARAALVTEIDTGDMAVYQPLRRRRGGVAVAQVLDGTCSACGVGLSPSLEWQLRQGKLTCCGNCERILVRV